MTRPDWCPQRVWDEAEKSMTWIFSGSSGPVRDRATTEFARAIIGAEQRERERIAEQVEQFGSDDYVETGKRQAQYICQDLAAAIRNRGSDNDH